jgi:hypothetical protein
MELTRLEQAILSWIAAQHGVGGRDSEAAVIRREHSEAGSYTHLSGPEQNGQSKRVDGPQIQSPGLKHGAGSILWLKDGVPDCLEVYAFGDDLWIDLDEFTLCEGTSDKPVQPTRARGPRD